MAAFSQVVKPGLDSEWEEMGRGGSEVALGQVISWSAAPAPPSARHACFGGQIFFSSCIALNKKDVIYFKRVHLEQRTGMLKVAY